MLNDNQPTTKLDSALWWVRRFFWLVPCQPGTKHQVSGFGANLKTVSKSADIQKWFGSNEGYNLAVVGWPRAIMLDFDNPELYQAWVKDHPIESQTYTERSPRGGAHVVMFAQDDQVIPEGLKYSPGVERKTVMMVYPSIVDGKQYTRGEGDILTVNPVEALSGLTVSGTPTPYKAERLQADKRPRSVGILADIKSRFELVKMFQEIYPGIELRGIGTRRWVTGRCPFCGDQGKDYHLFVDTKKNMWGCHREGYRGDIVNLWARSNQITVKEAIDELARRGGIR